ncbi:MAG: cytochrome c [Pseudomonadales bacterium]|nr:cytochrome c [Pseudomonadales bacterium]
MKRRLCKLVLTFVAAGTATTVTAQDAGQLKKSEAVYTYWCATCHASGPGMPGTQALQAKYNGKPPAVLIERADLSPELVKLTVRNGVSVMPFFRKTEISDAELDALAAWLSKGTSE